jgi:tetratricopeptide (TPR) repeat protein
MKRTTVPARGQPLARERLRGLAAGQSDRLLRAIGFAQAGRHAAADHILLDLSREVPDHPEVLRWLAAGDARRGEWARAAALLERSVALRPGDPATLVALAAARDNAGDFEGALRGLEAAAAAAGDAGDLIQVSIECDRQGHAEDALAAIEGALARSPDAPVALLQRARCLQILGRAELAAADYRRLIARDRFAARAWFGLVDLKTVRLSGEERAQLERAAGAAGHSRDDRMMLDFALGKAREDAGEHASALAALDRANAAARPTHPWDGAAFTRHVDAVARAFASVERAAQPQGREVIFLVGLPRSGTTLVEQVLAAHSQVEGASELPYLGMVVERESARRGRAFPDWAGAAAAEDWTRLGREYLDLSARWRTRRPIATDKLPENWLLAGAALAMLPEARVIDCRRDPVETCWSCYKQLFAPGRVGFTYDFATLAAYWHDYDRLCRLWAERYPRRFRVQSYEELVAQPQAQIRSLLEFCDLPFEPGCLEFHKAERAIRTPSSSQVREPMRKTSMPAAGYGALLDPLRALLGPARGERAGGASVSGT